MRWTDRARRFRELHDRTFILPRVESQPTARSMIELGFEAFELAADLGCGALIASAAAEFPRAPIDVARRARDLVAQGFVGVTLHDEGLDVDAMCARIEAAQVDPLLIVKAATHAHVEGTLSDALERVRAYAAAGASVVEAPGLRRAEDIRAVVDAASAWVDVTLGLGGVPPSLETLAELGVRRVSTGHVFAALGPESAMRAAREMQQHGTFEFLVELDR